MASPRLSLLDTRVSIPAALEEHVRTALSPVVWAMLAGIVSGGSLVQLPIFLMNRNDPTRHRAGRFFRDLGVLAAKLNPMWDFQVHGSLPDYTPGRTVIVSNHVSNSDVFLIAHVPYEMKWLGKASLFRVPVFGQLMQMAGDVPLERGTRDSVVEAMKKCRAHLDRGMPVMIFPEGTRSKTADLLPFKDGAFRLAVDAGADVLPLAVAGTRDALPKHSWRFGFARGLVHVGTPISTAGLTHDDIPALRERARDAVAELYREILPLVG
ncbi:MAG: lysophospholipid acyltransferase family protein [Myxococcota bacterium]